MLKDRNCQPRILYLAKLFFRYEGEIEVFSDRQKLREFPTTRPAFQDAEWSSSGWHEKILINSMKTWKYTYGIVEWLMHHTNVGLQFPKSIFHHVYKETIHVDQLLY